LSRLQEPRVFLWRRFLEEAALRRLALLSSLS